MKYVIFLSDGMADLPLEELGGMTPMMRAHKPHMDRMAREGFAGMIRTIPDSVPPGSDTANMSVMGYDPVRYYTGRSPIEAVSMSIDLESGDVAFRCNLVTLSEADAYGQRVMADYSADEIGSDEAARIIETVNARFAADHIRFYPGKSYRHCMVWQNGPSILETTPPHDILTRRIGDYLPAGDGADRLLAIMRDSVDLLSDHPVNRARTARGLRPANAVWIWGQGTRPELPRIADTFGLRGSVISAVDLVNGLGICAGLHVVEVPGITGNIHTNFAGKGQAAIEEFRRGQDYVYLHVEAPDECGHRAETDNKVLSIEKIDQEIIGPVWAYLEKNRQLTGEDYRMLSLPDHATPISLRTHTRQPVPFALYDSAAAMDVGNTPAAGRSASLIGGTAANKAFHADAYDEVHCDMTGLRIDEGHTLFRRFIEGFM